MTTTTPADGHPLGDVDGTAPTHAEAKSIVDEVLNLDEFLSADVRLPERTFILYTEPDREGRIHELSAELTSFLDPQGRPLAQADASVGDARNAGAVSAELLEEQRAYHKSGRYMRVRAMSADEWPAWEKAHAEALKAGPPYPPETWEDLILKGVILPRFKGVEQVRKFREHVGWAAYLELGQECFNVNVSSGVDLPKSSLSSVATRLVRPA